MIRVILVLMLVFGIKGCGDPAYTQEEGAYIAWKTPAIRYADQGFIYKSPTDTKIEIYGNGQPLMQIRIDKEHICTSFWQCFSKEKFNERFLSKYYPPDTLERIFRAEPIFGGDRIKHKGDGFVQMLNHPHKYKINYQVLNNQIVFRDTINKIQLKVRK